MKKTFTKNQQINQVWLIISHGFNMDGRAASLTVTDKIPFLIRRGIEPIILSAITGKKDLRFAHYQLLPWGPSGLRFDFRHLVANQFGRGSLYKFLTTLVSFLLLPFTTLEKLIFGLSSQWSWTFPAFFKAKKLIKNQKIDVIYTSGGAWAAHYAGYLIHQSTGIKWLAEIHDPMVIRDDLLDHGLSPRMSRDARFLQKLEGLICRNADHVWWFTQGALDYAKFRHPELMDRGFVVFPGSEPAGCRSPLPKEHHYNQILQIAHFGSLANDRSIAPLLEAMRTFFQKYNQAKNHLKINIFGSGLDSSSKEALDRLEMSAFVNLHGRIETNPITGQSGREQVMALMRSSDVLLMLHGNYEWCAEYIPSKLYDYFWANRPIWAITNRNPNLDEILKERGHYISHTLENSSIVSTLEEIWLDWQSKQLIISQFDPISPKDAVESILDKIYPQKN